MKYICAKDIHVCDVECVDIDRADDTGDTVQTVYNTLKMYARIFITHLQRGRAKKIIHFMSFNQFQWRNRTVKNAQQQQHSEEQKQHRTE